MSKIEFISGLLPGNYALTKSMELGKIQTSGTLWYTKKFLVLYYYIFLSNKIQTNEYISEVITAFDNYISTLDKSVRAEAEKFFYSDSPWMNFKSDEFESFSIFAPDRTFSNSDELNDYLLLAKKFYFIRLMDIGGQTGIKKSIKEKIQTRGFSYYSTALNSFIKNEIIDICYSDCITRGQIRDNYVKYVISDVAIKRINEHGNSITKNQINEIIINYPKASPNFIGIKNDVVAAIRNERQILYYYGFFHSKTTGASDVEFSSLTPVGELGVIANSKEFLVLWEHQKIKMISQPPTVEIMGIPSNTPNGENFDISYSPYLDILSHLVQHNELGFDFYQYVLSRKTESNSTSLNESISDFLLDFSDVKDQIQSFGRTRDTATEDSQKELKKYLLGIRADLSKDNKMHDVSLVELRASKVIVKDKQHLSFLAEFYNRITTYKINKYRDLFERCKKDLCFRYCESIKGNDIPTNPKVKIDWDLFNIRIDGFIILACLTAINCKGMTFSVFEQLNKSQLISIAENLFASCKELLKKIGYRTVLSLKKELISMHNAIIRNDYALYLSDQENRREVVAKYREWNATDLMQKIVNTSNETVSIGDERKRNMSLVSLLKSYYLEVYAEHETLRCECCGHEAFIAESNEPYVEFHHLIPFNIASGPDHYLNLFALCPNCHRKIHFIRAAEKETLYDKLSENNYLQKSFVDRLFELKVLCILKSYHLEYLLAEQAITQQQYEAIAA